jgi:hypothetical protein
MLPILGRMKRNRSLTPRTLLAPLATGGRCGMNKRRRHRKRVWFSSPQERAAVIMAASAIMVALIAAVTTLAAPMTSGHFETRYSKGGHAVQLWVSDMPRLPDSILDCVVYLYPSEAAAEDGELIGGTGFLAGLPLTDELNNIITHLPCVVTNKHVIKNGSMIVRLNTRDGKTDVIPLDGIPWFEHPAGDDLACCPIGLNLIHKYNYLPAEMLGNRKTMDGMEVGIGDEVFIVGRFINRDGKQQNTPTVRFGNIAQMPHEPTLQEDGFLQDNFLVEARSISGYSGSPVFWYIPPQVSFAGQSETIQRSLFASFPLVRKNRQGLWMGFGPQLLGIGYSYVPFNQPAFNKHTRKPDENLFIKSNTGMMGVIPAWKLTEMLLGETMSKITEQASKMLRKQKPGEGVVLTSAEPDSATDENPDHKADFDNLLKKAAKVTKDQ